MARATNSTTPLRTSAVVMISSERIMMTVSLPKPAKASRAGSKPVIMSVSNKPSATTSADTHSKEKRMSATRTRPSNRAMDKVTRYCGPGAGAVPARGAGDRGGECCVLRRGAVGERGPIGVAALVDRFPNRREVSAVPRADDDPDAVGGEFDPVVGVGLVAGPS